MKSHSSSPQSSPQAIRVYRVDTNPTGTLLGKKSITTSPAQPLLQKATLRVIEHPDEAVSLPMAASDFQAYGSPPTKNGSHPAITNTLLTPIHNGTRKTSSGNVDSPTSVPAINGDSSPSLSTNVPYGNATPLSANSDTAGQWSSAVGHATTSGKSGRVIERLMTENDRLKRELNEQHTKVDELQRNVQTYRPQIDALRAENDNLSHTRSVDTGLITRRDRKIEELKNDLALEKQRRQSMETRARSLEQERDEAVEEKAREVQTLTETTKHATVHAEILEKSHKQLALEYRSKTEASRKELAAMQKERAHDRQRLQKLDVVSEQMRQENERNRKAQTDMLAAWEELQGLTQQKLHGMEEESSMENERLRQLSGDMEKVVNEMRWLMGLKRSGLDSGREESIP